MSRCKAMMIYEHCDKHEAYQSVVTGVTPDCKAKEHPGVGVFLDHAKQWGGTST
jgi:hypothetical protein